MDAVVDPVVMHQPSSKLTVAGSTFAVGIQGDVTQLKLPSSLPRANADVVFDGQTVTVLRDGAVLEGFDLRGYNVVVKANNVTIRTCLGSAATWNTVDQYSGFSGLTVEYCTFDGQKANIPSNAILFNRAGIMTVRNNEFFDTPTDVIHTVGGTVERNYFSGSGYGTDAHADAISVHQTVAPVAIRQNYINWVTPSDAAVPVLDNAVRIAPHLGPIQDVSVQDNVLLGGGYTVFVANAQYQAANVAVDHNQIGLGKWGPLYPEAQPATFSFTRNSNFASGAVLPTVGAPIEGGPKPAIAPGSASAPAAGRPVSPPNGSPAPDGRSSPLPPSSK